MVTENLPDTAAGRPGGQKPPPNAKVPPITTKPSDGRGRESTPYSWPEGAEPTDEQVAAWLTICTPEERLERIHWWREQARQQFKCWAEDHPSTVERLRRLDGFVQAAVDEGRNVLPDATDDQAAVIEAWAKGALYGH